MMNAFSGKLAELLKQYYVVGGMPEAVNAMRLSLSGYREQDWMRNVPLYAVSCRALWA